MFPRGVVEPSSMQGARAYAARFGVGPALRGLDLVRDQAMQLAAVEIERKRKRVAELSAAMIEQAAELRMLQGTGSSNAGLGQDVGYIPVASTFDRSPDGQRLEDGDFRESRALARRDELQPDILHDVGGRPAHLGYISETTWNCFSISLGLDIKPRDGAVYVRTVDNKVFSNGCSKTSEHQFKWLHGRLWCSRVTQSHLFMRLSKDGQGVVFDPAEIYPMMRHVVTNLVRLDTTPVGLRFLWGASDCSRTEILSQVGESYMVLEALYSGKFAMETGPHCLNILSGFGGNFEYDVINESATTCAHRVLARFLLLLQVFTGEASEGCTWAEAVDPMLLRLRTDPALRWSDADRLVDGIAGVFAQWFDLVSSNTPILSGGVQTAWAAGAARSLLRDLFAAFIVDTESTRIYELMRAKNLCFPLVRKKRGPYGGGAGSAGEPQKLPVSFVPVKDATISTPVKATAGGAMASTVICLASVVKVLGLQPPGKWFCKDKPCEWMHYTVSELVPLKEEIMENFQLYYPDPTTKDAAVAALKSL